MVLKVTKADYAVTGFVFCTNLGQGSILWAEFVFPTRKTDTVRFCSVSYERDETRLGEWAEFVFRCFSYNPFDGYRNEMEIVPWSKEFVEAKQILV